MLTNVVLVPPFESHLQIMISLHHRSELRKELLALGLVQFIDHLGERPGREYALPPRHWIRSHDGVYCLQRPTDILRAPARLLVDLDLLGVGVRRLDETISDEGGSQALKELLIHWGEAVVEFVSRGPERVTARGGELSQAERSVVCGYGLELYVRVP